MPRLFALFAMLLCPTLSGGGDRPELPDGRTIDTLEWGRTDLPGRGESVGPAALLSVTGGGKVSYFYQSRPTTGSGGHVVRKEWDIPEAEAKALLRGLVEDGLLRIEHADNRGIAAHYGVQVTYGRWRMSYATPTMPRPILERLLPFLREAHPELWGKAGEAPGEEAQKQKN